jgi:hypothetical protein
LAVPFIEFFYGKQFISRAVFSETQLLDTHLDRKDTATLAQLLINYTTFYRPFTQWRAV